MTKGKRTGKEKGLRRDGLVLWGIRGLLRLQSRWADWMERKTENISPKMWAVLLTGFVMVSVGFNAWLIWYSISGKDRQEISVTPVQKPGYITRPGNEVLDSLVKDSLLRNNNNERQNDRK
ncbi:hypothetical protein [Sinomicrobium weinanense]|uniref:Uncharacterized protein n=1 Tax=Sinomicrobium weinanense TaxID=2842200 RepID=A0A926JU57_9FLAO|nr:hypothetical protein [Sinomicrobium weinanense]MBC9797582.1 hypothetical protein [Sinomicrobium weinanense]MBU3123649.1 hypothetical protein [Sinomicrobium weinanense]